MKRIFGFSIFAGLLAVATGLLFSQDQASTRTRDGDETAIKQTSQQLARAFEKGDAAAVAGFWTENGEYSDEEGLTLRGRETITKAFTKLFANRKEVKVEGVTNEIRFVGNDSAIEEGTFTVRAKDSPANSNKYTAMFIRQDGKWLIATMREWSIATTGQASLEDISWLIGSWESTSGEAKARTTYEWVDASKKFIRATYKVEIKDKDKVIATGGTQIIGIDPALGNIKSWTFDSEGGVGEAVWNWDENRWMIHSSGTLSEGLDTSATNLLTKTGNDSFTWRSVQRSLNGEELADLPAVTVKRVSGEGRASR